LRRGADRILEAVDEAVPRQLALRDADHDRDQRAGRAAREGPGRVVRAYAEAEYAAFRLSKLAAW
jgi:hypothetical protein